MATALTNDDMPVSRGITESICSQSARKGHRGARARRARMRTLSGAMKHSYTSTTRELGRSHTVDTEPLDNGRRDRDETLLQAFQAKGPEGEDSLHFVNSQFRIQKRVRGLAYSSVGGNTPQIRLRYSTNAISPHGGPERGGANITEVETPPARVKTDGSQSSDATASVYGSVLSARCLADVPCNRMTADISAESQ